MQKACISNLGNVCMVINTDLFMQIYEFSEAYSWAQSSRVFKEWSKIPTAF